MQQSGFHTPSGYRDTSGRKLTEAMEDYLEMICRTEGESIRIGELATALQVRPSSATRMVQKLAEGGWLTYNRYDVVRPTAEGGGWTISAVAARNANEFFSALSRYGIA